MFAQFQEISRGIQPYSIWKRAIESELCFKFTGELYIVQCKQDDLLEGF